jgi:phage terminase large subunit
VHELSYFKQVLKQKTQERLTKEVTNPVTIDECADLFLEQRNFIDDKARYKVAVCSRRAGKTSAIARKLRKVATGGWEHNAIYVAKTTDQCKRIMWNILLQVLQKYHRKKEYKTNASDLSVYFYKTNSFIWLKGASDSTQILKLLGIKIKFACIDEAQSFPSYLEYLIDQVLSPALTDLQGELALTGTPNPTCSGYFYEVSHRNTWSQHHWTIENNTFYIASAMKENPNVHSVTDIIQQEANRRGVTLDDAAIQRDFFGRWSKSTELQVYKYAREKQDFMQLPELSFEVVLGIDVGFDDHDAIVCLGFNKSERCCYLLEEYKQNKTDITTLAEKIKHFVKKYAPYVCVIDAGALGKKISFELSTRHQLTLVAAEKERKAEYIALMNDDMHNGRIKIKAKSRLAQEMQMLCWDQEYFDSGKFIENPDFDNHLCDSALYAWRWAYHYLYRESKEKELTYEQRDEARIIEKFEKEKEKSEYGFDW